MTQLRKPVWLKVSGTRSAGYLAVDQLLQEQQLQTVCFSARCPNRGGCWQEGTAAFMILGGVCTRNCAFCAVPSGKPAALDREEPSRLLAVVRRLGLRHVVITSVDRDDLADGGASQFVACVHALREGALANSPSIELLTPDFRGKEGALEQVLASAPEVFNHNMETVARLYPRLRPAARYDYSLQVLAQASAYGLCSKSGIMLGLGEEQGEVEALLEDLRAAGVAIVTIGQYLQPTRTHQPVERYVPPEEFIYWQERAEMLGFEAVESHPLARSSFHALQLLDGVEKGGSIKKMQSAVMTP
ncbi:lipoyl synthase [Candidatus Magnetaquicoccus inordinatus]|uniref:lipoyl synthase n=1 Tax=Candidatus Magnetaquicoccus inordinatus TaxID=2496818 RepID=UPI00102C9EB6|nr:lipoyl synthase [Candidatus Magnetaquicoccus inordinatus]